MDVKKMEVAMRDCKMEVTIDDRLAKMLAKPNMYEQDKQMLLQAEAVIQAIERCIDKPNATITISVTHDEDASIKATADLYDLAALNTLLIDALKYFQEEIS